MSDGRGCKSCGVCEPTLAARDFEGDVAPRALEGVPCRGLTHAGQTERTRVGRGERGATEARVQGDAGAVRARGDRADDLALKRLLVESPLARHDRRCA